MPPRTARPPGPAEPAPDRARPYARDGSVLAVLEMWLVVLLALAGEAALAAAAVAAVLGGVGFAAGHAAVLALLAGWAWSLRRRGEALHVALLLLLTTAVAGVLGAVGTLLTLLYYEWVARDAVTFEAWYASLFPEEESTQARDLFEQIASGRDISSEHQSVTSFSDILAFGTSDQKRAVISLLSRNWQPGFAPALLRALADRDPAIRVQAATAASEIENAFLERAMRLKSETAARPDDVDLCMELARHHDDYAYSGLLDAARAEDSRLQALDRYRRALEIDPGLTEAWIAVGRLLLRLGRSVEAAGWFARALRAGQTSPQIVDWHLESLYRLGDFAAVREAARARAADFTADAAANELRIAGPVRLWAAGMPTRPGAAEGAA